MQLKKDNVMVLPINYYDFIQKLRPNVLKLTEQDAKDLLASPNPLKTIHSVDSYDSRYKECLDAMTQELTQKTGLSIEELKSHLEAAPDLKIHLASTFHTVNQEYHCLVNFMLSGKKTFYFSDNLSEHLANTEINLKAGLVELPFPSCLFVFTSPAVINAMHNTRGKGGRWDMNDNSLDYTAPVSVFLTMHPADADLPTRKLVIVAWHARLPENSYLMLKRELCMEEDWTLEQALRTDWEKVDPENHGEGININFSKEVYTAQADSMFYTDGLAFYRIILNAILYLSSDQAELAAKKTPRNDMESAAAKILSAPKRKKALRLARSYSGLDYEEVGSSVGLIVIQQSTDEGSEHGAGGSKPLVRFMVRGHWRHQPHGPGNQERKLIWIRPFYKGADLAAQINKPYLVK